MRESRARMDGRGRIGIPAAWRKSLAMRPGEPLILVEAEGGLLVLTGRQAVRRAQALVRAAIPPGRSLSSELLAERRAEARRPAR